MITEVAALPLDRRRSPLTGWTRAHHALVADRQLLALRRWASPGRARFDLPGPSSRAGRDSDGLEAFARSFLTAGFRLGGADDDPHDLAGWYADGLAAGTDPQAVDAWPRMSDVRQARVEAAALCIGLHESRAQIWDRLDRRVQERVIDWLSEALGGGYGDNNWRWFANVTQAFLQSVGGPYAADELQVNLDFLDDCYLGDGWYSDGRPDRRSGNIDWYNPWVMHLFSLWYCRILGADAPAGLLDRYRDRLAAFLPQGLRLFGADGAPLYQGRSLVYRFATTGAFWAAPVFGIDTASPGQIRAVGSGALRYFVEHDAYDEQDLLSLGWHGRFEPMRQPYSGPGSPYWAGLGFAGLLLGEDHPVWTEVEADVPEPDGEVASAPPGWLVGRSGGIVRVVNHRVDHATAQPTPEDPQYCRLGYSSATAPVAVSAGDQDAVVDNQVAVQALDGRWSHRRPINDGGVVDAHDGGAQAWSRHTAWFPGDDDQVDTGPLIEVWSVLRGDVEVRIVRVASAEPVSRLVISGFAVPAAATVASRVEPLLGDLRIGVSEHAEPNPFGDQLQVPWVMTSGPVAVGEWYAAAVRLGRPGVGQPLPLVSVAEDAVVVDWGDRQDRVSVTAAP